MSYTSEIGRIGEQLVADYLKSKGFLILKQNYRSGFGEIDIIAETPDEIIFVEVKTRKEDFLASPADAVDYNKQRKIIKTAYEFLKRIHVRCNIRFDIAEVTYTAGEKKRFSLNYVKNAFHP